MKMDINNEREQVHELKDNLDFMKKFNRQEGTYIDKNTLKTREAIVVMEQLIRKQMDDFRAILVIEKELVKGIEAGLKR